MGEEPAKVKRNKSMTWRSELFRFSQNTTLHGLKQVTAETPFRTRRIIWIGLVLGGFSLFIYQVVMSLLLFLSCPVAVNVKINYVSNVTFPAVTFCNQNAFRASRAAKNGWYEALFDMYGASDDERKKSLAVLGSHSFMDLLKRTGHEEEDMIVSCRWGGKDCAEGSLTKTFTDQGVCFTFNADLHPRIVTQTGKVQIILESHQLSL
ncbi:acid-sensing ion channel 5-like [Lingula anatina]|uniref:Acid-sensing ion channel 5-like n=1 Tax=Lingula anatina TaxID=7574 RepID=A0A1S3JVH8_LINAN|nr:acid-sensing ion channel 5-like [Lingula anatina]|eukprot:XP_013414061.1 acid-sensing ion channel 5-like [Lingula anatina]